MSVLFSRLYFISVLSVIGMPGPRAADITTDVTTPARSEPGTEGPASASLLDHGCLALPAEGADPETLAGFEARGLPVGDIQIVVDPIFDTSKPEEDNWLFRLVNDWHVPTDTEVIRDDLLFEPGEPFRASRMAESERVLRTRRYLRGADIRPVGECLEKVDLEVRVKDVWTLVPDISFSRSGGDNSSRFGFRDSNFLGTGRAVQIVREQDAERTGTMFGYRDPSFGNTRSILDLEYTNNDDGQSHAFELYRPFFSLETPWAGGVLAHRDLRTDTLNFRDEEIQSFEHEEENHSVFGGWSRGLIGHETQRWRFGLSDEDSRFQANEDTVPAQPFPRDRHYRYGWLEWERVHDSFVKAVNINQMRRTEDINTGWITLLRFGRADDAIGSTDEAWLYFASAERYYLVDDDKVMFLSGAVDGRHDGDQVIDQRSELHVRYYQGDFRSHQFYAALRLQHGRNLFVDNPITLGGDNGLRGYPTRYQMGDRMALLTLEERFYLFTEVLSLFDVGAAVFADVGRAWFDGRDNGYNGGWLRDVGFGLRLTPTRTGNERPGKQTVLHLDLAAPLNTDADPELDKLQWLVTIRDSF
ncbi:MAG: hypothetical protein ACOY3E_14885 [Pseudomonadota bacterium]